MLLHFIAVTLTACTIGLLTACDSTIQPHSAQPAPGSENTLQLKFPNPPSAEMKNELKREKYQLQQSDRDVKDEG